CDSLSPFARAKLWVLNGAHSALAYAGQLRGMKTVAEAASDPDLRRTVQSLMVDAVLPLLEPLPGLPLEDYAHQIWARFENPELAHQLAQIAWDGSQKIPVRIIDPMLLACSQGHDPKPFARVIGSWLAFIHMRYDTGETFVDPEAERLLAWAHQVSSLMDPVSTAFESLAPLRMIPKELTARSSILDAARQSFEEGIKLLY
ncbi:MAG: mannitol dehydrogenase family protein, partial [Asticcacaulis sp.]